MRRHDGDGDRRLRTHREGISELVSCKRFVESRLVTRRRVAFASPLNFVRNRTFDPVARQSGALSPRNPRHLVIRGQ